MRQCADRRHEAHVATAPRWPANEPSHLNLQARKALFDTVLIIATADVIFFRGMWLNLLDVLMEQGQRCFCTMYKTIAKPKRHEKEQFSLGLQVYAVKDGKGNSLAWRCVSEKLESAAA